MLVALLATAALAGTPDTDHVWAKQIVGVGGWPSGAISDTKVQLRRPGHRSDSVLFQNTYYGVGGRLQASPAFVDVGPRVSLAPIDILDVDLQGAWTGYAGPFAPLPMAATDGRVESARNARNGEEMAVTKWEASVAPTLKLKVGPLVAFDSLTVGALSARYDDPTELWYEPYRDLVVARNDVTIENQAALLVEVLDGDGRAKLLVGPQTRLRQAMVSGDGHTNVGALVAFRPGASEKLPTLIAQGHAYVRDVERVGTAPNLQLAAAWTLDRVLR